MKDFKGSRKPGGFGGKSSFGSRGGSSRPQRGGFGDSDRGGRDFERPTMHQAVCSDCGDKCEVPFRPNGTKPVLCSSCFSIQKEGGRQSFDRRDRGGRDFSASKERTMFKATCQECNSPCEVPFRPTEGKPIFCSDCFRGHDAPAKNAKSRDGGSEQLTAIHAKLDQILNILKANSAFVSKVEKAAKQEETLPVVKAIKKAEKEEKEEIKVEAKLEKKTASKKEKKEVKKEAKKEPKKKVKKEVKVKAVKAKVAKTKTVKKKA